MKKIVPATLLLALLAGCGSTGNVSEPAYSPTGPAPTTAALSTAAAPTIKGTLTVNGSASAAMKPGQPALWAIGVRDSATGQPVTQFEIEHEKYMHLIVVSRDLSSFAHVHPTLAGGSFSQQVNQSNTDPDNQDAARAVTQPGPFLLFSEVKPQGQDVQTMRFTVTADGQENPVPLKLDPASANGAIVKYFNADCTPGKKGDAYQVTVTPMNMSGMVHINFNIQAAMQMGSMTHYMPVTDLEPWLGMPGHAILISQAGDKVEDKVFRHLHSGDMSNMGGMPMPMPSHGGSGSGPDVLFMLMGDDLVPSGTYKIWGQLKRKGKVLTFPFVIQL